MHRHHHDHDHHGHDHGPARQGHEHRSLWLAPTRFGVHPVGRRQFLADLGRGTFAIALLGGAAACSSDDDADPAATVSPTSPTSPPDEASGSQEARDVSADDVNELRWAQVSLGFVSAYVLVRGNEAAVVDTGSSGSADQIGAALATLSANFDDVRHVVLTHLHNDHVGSLPEVLGRAASASAYAGAADIPDIASPAELIPVGDGDDVFGLQVIHTPGHTPGSISLLDPGIGLLLVGDALTGNGDGTGLSGPNEQFTPDMATAHQSAAKLAGRDVEAVAMGHGQPVESGGGALLQSLVDGLDVTSEVTSG